MTPPIHNTLKCPQFINDLALASNRIRDVERDLDAFFSRDTANQRANKQFMSTIFAEQSNGEAFTHPTTHAEASAGEVYWYDHQETQALAERHYR